jgi:hypothetical protein
MKQEKRCGLWIFWLRHGWIFRKFNYWNIGNKQQRTTSSIIISYHLYVYCWAVQHGDLRICVSNFSVQKSIKKPEGIMFSQRIFPEWRVIKEKQPWHTVTVVRKSLVPMVCRISASMCSLGKIQELMMVLDHWSPLFNWFWRISPPFGPNVHWLSTA